ncbi:class I SAM-dependent DNA methyltransferase [Qipengyuania gelatinilytica]|uniref:site-specific DNA-methyltransferase (adenine-specific) n=1 Tax=Qipengyuania gelatinilytica TaxID=2867231 RepID=A0ABX9A460_9SPHN|nr:DNA methyltransferase [Qipengyuania gelatinilytica]QZD94612.1 lactate dehydrogenase [Qipengyuania gelatinilytica]
MNAVEIEEAISELAEQPFDKAEFPFQFLAAFGNKATTIKRLRSGASNSSDLEGGVLQRNNIHIATCTPGEVDATLQALRHSPQTASARAKFILATDGETLQAEEVGSDEAPIACEYADFPDHFGFLLPLAGITTVKQIRESSFDIKATGRLNRLYVELLKDNPDWDTDERRPDMNHFMARLIFCFFAEDTDIFHGEDLFTRTIEQMSERDSSNTHEVISEIFRAMDCKLTERDANETPRYANQFPYVNGELFSGSTEVPTFSRIARSYLINIGNLDWKKINPDIFGSMIQAVADDEERGALGMHYTSVPNILKVLNPLFLDDLREKLEEAGDSPIKLLNLRKRMSKIRVFDPACGSGNFLVIAYKEMRAIEAEINQRRDEEDRRSDIPLTNFRGIELRDFPAEVARLALIIAEYQCDVLYRGQKEALAEFLPLDAENWITSGNALHLDWLSICPPTSTVVKHHADDLFHSPLDQAQIDFENEGGETYLCGNPPYIGTKYQTKTHKEEISKVFSGEKIKFGNVDYIGCWFLKAAKVVKQYASGSFAFVSTNSLFQGEQAEIILHILQKYGVDISWAHPSFPWSNNAAKNAGVICSIVGFTLTSEGAEKFVFEDGVRRKVGNVGPYLVPMPNVVVRKSSTPMFGLNAMSYGSMSNDNGLFGISSEQYRQLVADDPANQDLIKRAVGGAEFIRGIVRRSVYVSDAASLSASQKDTFRGVFEGVRAYRAASNREATRKLSKVPMLFAERRHVQKRKLFVPQVLSERREYVTAGILGPDDLVIAPHMQVIEGELFEFSILSSKMHHVWVATVCGRLKSDIRYSNSLGWNTFPIPQLTQKNRDDLSRRAEEILLAREAHFPASIAEIYDPENMPVELREAHEKNDETLERIYIGRRFQNNSERLEKLIEQYARKNKRKKSLNEN